AHTGHCPCPVHPSEVAAPSYSVQRLRHWIVARASFERAAGPRKARSHRDASPTYGAPFETLGQPSNYVAVEPLPRENRISGGAKRPRARAVSSVGIRTNADEGQRDCCAGEI